MIDIHCHILPGIDDGSDNTAESREMFRQAAEGGTTDMILTPHAGIPGIFRNYWNEELRQMFKTTEAMLKTTGIPINIYPGQEVFLTDKTLELLKDGSVICLNHSRYILCETDFGDDFEGTRTILKKIKAEGYVPILAHPERYRYFNTHKKAEDEFKEEGILLQLNINSLDGTFGRHARKTAERILGKNMADFIASDAHEPIRRTPDMRAAYESVAQNYTSAYADILFEENPRKVINNQEI